MRRRPTAQAMLVAGLVLIVAHAAAPDRTLRVVLSLLALGVVAGAAGLHVLTRRATVATPWRWVAVGLVVLWLGDGGFALLDLIGVAPTSLVRILPDVGYLLGYLAIGIGILALTRTHSGQRAADLVIDTTVVSIACGLAAAQLINSSSFADATMTGQDRAVLVSYAVAHAVHVVAVVRLLALHRVATAGVLASAGVALLLSMALTYLLSSSAGSYELGGGHWLESMWLAGAFLLAAAVVHPSAGRVELGTRAPSDGALRVVVGVGCLASPAVVLGLVDPSDLAVGAWLWVLATVVLGLLVVLRTVRILAARDRADAGRDRVSRRYRALAANSSDAYLLVDATGLVVEASPTYGEVIDDPDADPVGQSLFRRVDPEDLDAMRNAFSALLTRPGRATATELRIAGPDGCDRWLNVRGVNLLEDPDVGLILFSLQNVTDRRLAEERLEHHVLHDPVTGAANRLLLADRVHQATVQLDRSDGAVALIVVELHELGRVNERFGHDGGDELLRAVHDRLRSVVRASDTVARLGGDSFALLLLQGGDGPDELDPLTDRLLATLDQPFDIEGETVLVTACLGVVVVTARTDADSLLRDAGMALGVTRRDVSRRVVDFEPAMRDEAIDRLRIESDLTVALERGELELFYQPLLDLQSGGIRGVEALLRWHHPEVGLIPPDRFIPVAERTRLIIPIGEWVIETACRTAMEWRDALGTDLEMNVNISAQQLASDSLMVCVREALAVTGLPPSRLVLEVTESALIADADMAAGQLHALRAAGVRIAIDDFGTGYSSLSYLQQFPVDVLKIDRSFVSSVMGDQPVPPLVRGVVELARTLSLETVAEGIEDAGQAMQLREEGCHLGQGYLFSRPLPAADALAHLKANGLPPVGAAVGHAD